MEDVVVPPTSFKQNMPLFRPTERFLPFRFEDVAGLLPLLRCEAWPLALGGYTESCGIALHACGECGFRAAFFDTEGIFLLYVGTALALWPKASITS